MFRETITWRGRRYESLRDILAPGLDIMFVGINPSIASVDVGHYHQGFLGRRFWDTVIHGGILKPAPGRYPDEVLFEQKMGITDIVRRPTRGLRFLTQEDFEEGRSQLFQKIVRYKPKIVCAIYKTVLEQFFETKFTNIHGLLENYRIGKTCMFILAPFFYSSCEKEKTIEQLRELRIKIRKKKRSKD